MTRSFLTVCLSTTLIWSLCGGGAGAEKELEPGTHEQTLMFRDKPRIYQLHIPPAAKAKKPLPLVLALHGTKGDGLGILRKGWTKIADREGFLVVCPDGTGDPRSWPAGWNGPRAPAAEVEFLRTLLDLMDKQFRVDPKRVYVCGMSAGAHMSHRLGAELSDRIAAIGPVAGTIGARDGGKDTHTPDPKGPVSVIAIHGKKDGHVHYEGGKNTGGIDYLSVADSIAFWVKNDKCKAAPARTTLKEGNVLRETYSNGASGTEVVLVTIADGDHEWPTVSKTNAGHTIDATETLWAFFAAHPKK